MDLNKRKELAREKLNKKRSEIQEEDIENISENDAYNQALKISQRLLARFSDNENI